MLYQTRATTTTNVVADVVVADAIENGCCDSRSMKEGTGGGCRCHGCGLIDGTPTVCGASMTVT